MNNEPTNTHIPYTKSFGYIDFPNLPPMGRIGPPHLDSWNLGKDKESKAKVFGHLIEGAGTCATYSKCVP